jgi:hypothetical protein
MKTKTSLTAFLLPLAVAGFVAATTNVGHAVILEDPLHGVCAGCIDNGTNTPLVSQPFSFSVSPGPQTGTLLIDVLEPTAAQGQGLTRALQLVVPAQPPLCSLESLLVETSPISSGFPVERGTLVRPIPLVVLAPGGLPATPFTR